MTYLDTRDLLTELDELRTRYATLDGEDFDPLNEDEQNRLAELESLFSQISEDGEARYGATMIPVYDFEDYAQELAEDIGAIDRDAGWPMNCINWEDAARELSMDYTEVSFDGTDYFVRL